MRLGKALFASLLAVSLPYYSFAAGGSSSSSSTGTTTSTVSVTNTGNFTSTSNIATTGNAGQNQSIHTGNSYHNYNGNYNSNGNYNGGHSNYNSNNNYNSGQRLAEQHKIARDRQLLNSDRNDLATLKEHLRNDELHGNPSEVRADKAQIAALKEQTRATAVNLYTDGSYNYARRPQSLNGWGDNYSQQHRYSGWN